MSDKKLSDLEQSFSQTLKHQEEERIPSEDEWELICLYRRASLAVRSHVITQLVAGAGASSVRNSTTTIHGSILKAGGNITNINNNGVKKKK